MTGQNLSIHGHPFTGAQIDHIARLHLGNRHLDHGIAAMDARHAGLQPDQTADRLRGAPLGPRLKIAAQQDQGHDHRRRLEIHIHRIRGQQPRQKGRYHRIGIGRRGPHRDKAVHVRRRPQQRRIALEVEPPPRPQQDQRGQDELHHPACLHPDGGHDQVMHRGEQMRSHLHHENRQAQRGGNGQIALERDLLGLLARGHRVIRRPACRDGARVIAHRLDRLHQGCDIGGAAHQGALRRQIDRGGLHARHGCQRPLDPPHTGGAGHPLDDQIHARGRHVIARLLDRGDQQRAVQRGGGCDLGLFGRQIDTGRHDPRHARQRLLDPPHAGGAGHPLHRQ